MKFRRHYHEGPLDGHTEDIDRPGLEPDLRPQDPRTNTVHHYALIEPLPQFEGDDPVSVHYKHVTEFDPESDYMQRVGERRVSGAGGTAGSD